MPPSTVVRIGVLSEPPTTMQSLEDEHTMPLRLVEPPTSLYCTCQLEPPFDVLMIWPYSAPLVNACPMTSQVVPEEQETLVGATHPKVVAVHVVPPSVEA